MQFSRNLWNYTAAVLRSASAAFRRCAQTYVSFFFFPCDPIGGEMHGKGPASRCTHRIETTARCVQSNNFIQIATHLWSAYIHGMVAVQWPLACVRGTLAHVPCSRRALPTAHRCFLVVARNVFTLWKRLIGIHTTRKTSFHEKPLYICHRLKRCADEQTRN